MSHLGHLPEKSGAINPSSRTPVVALMLVGGAILVLAISLYLKDLAHFADTVLLLALIMVNGGLIYHRQKYPNLERPFRVPLVPLLPGLGIVANIYLLSQVLHHLLPVVMAMACLLLGVLAFLAWKGTQASEVALSGTPSRVALERFVPSESGFHVLVPLVNPANVHQLIELAAAVAAERKGEIVALRVALVPEQMPPTREDSYVERERQILELTHAQSLKYEVPITSLVRVGHDAGRAIL